jgi:hypothetical protein
METRAVSSLDLHTNANFSLPITYHSLIFDNIKIDVMESRPYKSTNILGRARIRLADLEIDHGSFRAISFPLRMAKGDGIVGSVILCFEFSGPSFDRSSAGIRPSLVLSEGNLTQSPDRMNSVDEIEDLLEDEIARDVSSTVSSCTSSVTKSPSMVSSFSSTTSPTINSGSARKVSNRPGFFMSERTSLGIRELAEFGNSFFNSGFILHLIYRMAWN